MPCLNMTQSRKQTATILVTVDVLAAKAHVAQGPAVSNLFHLLLLPNCLAIKFTLDILPRAVIIPSMGRRLF